jgi:hypothetical protein
MLVVLVVMGIVMSSDNSGWGYDNNASIIIEQVHDIDSAHSFFVDKMLKIPTDNVIAPIYNSISHVS